MIYLLDDKENRQKGFGWGKEKLSKYNSILKPLYNYEEIKTETSQQIFKQGNIVLFHASFFKDTNIAFFKDMNLKLRNRANNKANKIVVFSGSEYITNEEND